MIDFESVYRKFGGTIWIGHDCGVEVCGNCACCYPHYDHGRPSHIYYVPGELEFLKSALGSDLPARQLSPDIPEYHCFGNERCVYELRPLDCRSYPYWPIVHEGSFIGFRDLRSPRCPIESLPPDFREEIREAWLRVFERYREILRWLELSAPKPPAKLVLFSLNERK